MRIILQLIQFKIGEIAPQLQERIRQLSLLQLESLATAIFELSNEQNLAEWLRQNTEDSTSDESSNN